MNENDKQNDRCGCPSERVLFFPCSGGSNVGQIANAAAVQLTQREQGNMYCLAGIGGHIDKMLESAKGADRLVAIDGCLVACSKKTLEHADLTITDHVVVTEEGIDKNKNFDLPDDDIETIVSAVSQQLR